MATALCPDCGQKIVIGPKPKKGQWVSCPHCNADLEIISIRPLELDWVRFDDEDDIDDEVEEDLWDDDDDDYGEWEDDEDFDEEELDWDEQEEF